MKAAIPWGPGIPWGSADRRGARMTKTASARAGAGDIGGREENIGGGYMRKNRARIAGAGSHHVAGGRGPQQ